MNSVLDTFNTHKAIPVTVWIVIFSLVMPGCQIESASQHDEVIKTGMTMERALAILHKQGLNPQETGMQIGRVDGRPFDLFVLEPSGGTDALFLMMVEDQQGVKLLDSMNWWINWTTDSERSKGLRDYNWQDVDQIQVHAIKSRLRGEEATTNK